NPGGDWKMVERLHNELGYEVSVNWKEDLIVIGGNNEKIHSSEVIMLHYNGLSDVSEKLPDLHTRIDNSIGVLLDGPIVILGGTLDHSSKNTESKFWALNLEDPESEWKTLDSWPGPSRMLAVSGTHEKSLYLFSGTQLVDGQRKYLKDAYRYNADDGWTQIAD